MKRQIILEEADIAQFHDDAKHLSWIYQRMLLQHNEDYSMDYMRRFAKIIDKLQNL